MPKAYNAEENLATDFADSADLNLCNLRNLRLGLPLRGYQTPRRKDKILAAEMLQSRGMHRTVAFSAVLIAVALAPGASPAAQHRAHARGNRTVQPEKLDERIAQVRQLAARSPALVEEAKPLLSLADELNLEARKKADAGQGYSAERMAGACWSVTEAVEMLANARLKLPPKPEQARQPRHPDEAEGTDNDSQPSPERDAARELAMAYFRMAQLDFFSRQPGAGKLADLAKVSRRLYQEGRAAFDRNDLIVARQLAAASRELSAAVEKYIQAQLPEELPPPPKVDRE
jgi:hypothetical protein